MPAFGAAFGARIRLGSIIALVAAAACERPRVPTTPEVHGPLPGQFTLDLSIPTYDGSGETVHPDVADSPNWWVGAPMYIAITPYPNGNATLENPSLFAESGASQWVVPRGITNPLAKPDRGYLSDPDAVFDPVARELRVYYRAVTDANVIRMIRSSDGAVWSSPSTVVQAPNHQIVSPTVVRMPSGEWRMWSVNSGSVGCNAPTTSVELRESLDGVSWGAPRPVEIPAPPSGLMPWHIEVQWIATRQEYWALFNAKDGHSCGTTAIYLATSADGITWSTRPNPILIAGALGPLATIVYRSTFSYDPARDEVTIWYSGARERQSRMTWSTIRHRIARADLFADAADARLAASVAIPPGVPLIDPP